MLDAPTKHWQRKGIPCKLGRSSDGSAYRLGAENSATFLQTRNRSFAGRIADTFKHSARTFNVDNVSSELADTTKGTRVLARELEQLLQEKRAAFEMKVRQSALGSEVHMKEALVELTKEDTQQVADLCKVHLEVFSEYIENTTLFRKVLQEIHACCMRAVGALGASLRKCDALETTQKSLKQQYLKIAHDLHATFASRTAEAKETVYDAQRETADLKKEVESLTKTNIELKTDLAAARTRYEDEERQCKLSQRVTKDTHEALRELQHRSTSVMDENAMLRKIAQYNEDLLGELEELKAAVAVAEEKSSSADASIAAVVAERERSAAHSGSVILSLARTNKMQLAEIEALEIALQQSKAQHTDTTRQRDAIVQQYTPRPDVSRVQQELCMHEDARVEDLVAPNIAGSEHSTKQRFRMLTEHTAKVASALDQCNRRHVVAENLSVFLKADTEALAQRLETPVPAGRVFLAHGTLPTVPLYLRACGTIRHRLHTATDIRTLIRELDCYLEKQDPSSATPPELFHAFLQTRGGSFESQMETAYSVVDALDRLKFESDLLCLRRWLNMEAPFKMVKGVSQIGPKLLEGLLKVETKTNNLKGVIKRKVLWEHVAEVCRAYSEVDLLRLRNALHRDVGRQHGLPENSVRFEALFVPDENGRSSDLMSVLRELYVHDVDDLRLEWEAIVHHTTVAKQTSRALLVGAFLAVEPLLKEDAATAAVDEMLHTLHTKTVLRDGEPDMITADAAAVLAQNRRHFHAMRLTKRPDAPTQLRKTHKPTLCETLKAEHEALAMHLRVPLQR